MVEDGHGMIFDTLKSSIGHRELLYSMVARDLRGRYVGSALGVFWNVINPLILLGVYTFVFSYVLGTKVPSGAGTENFAVFLFCGLMPWIAFSESVTRSTTVISANASLVKKIKFPSEILVMYVAISSFIHEMLALVLFLGLLLVMGMKPGVLAVFLPAVFAVQLALTVGLSLLLASLNVYIRDVAHVISAAMMVLFFGTPIVYPIEMVPEKAAGLISFNPVAQLVEIYRDLLLRGQLHSLAGSAYLAAFSLCALWLGSYVFTKTKKDFADLV